MSFPHKFAVIQLHLWFCLAVVGLIFHLLLTVLSFTQGENSPRFKMLFFNFFWGGGNFEKYIV